MNKFKIFFVLALLIAGVVMLIRSTSHDPEGMDVICSHDVQKEVEDVFNSMLASGRYGRWDTSNKYWQNSPDRKQLKRYQIMMGVVKKYRTIDQVQFKISDAIEVPGQNGAVVMHGQLSNGQSIAVTFVKSNNQYKIENIKKFI